MSSRYKFRNGVPVAKTLRPSTWRLSRKRIGQKAWRARKLLKKAAAASLVQVKIEEEVEFEDNPLNVLTPEISIKEELPDDHQEKNTNEESYFESDQHEKSSQVDNFDHQYAIPQSK